MKRILCCVVSACWLWTAAECLAAGYTFEAVVREGDLVNGFPVLDLDTDDAPPQVNNRGDVAFLAVTGEGDSIYVRGANGLDRRVYGAGDLLIRPSDGRSIFVDNFDEDDFAFNLTNTGSVYSSDLDDLLFFAIEDELVGAWDDTLGDGSPVNVLTGYLTDTDAVYLYVHDLQEPDPFHTSVVSPDGHVFVETGRRIDGRRLRVPNLYVSSNDRRGVVYSTINDDDGSGQKFAIFKDGKFVSNEVLKDVNDSGQLLTLDFTPAEGGNRSIRSLRIDGNEVLTSDGLVDDNGARGAILSGIAGLTNDGNAISRVVFEGFQNEAGVTAFFFNSEEIFRVGELDVDDAVLNGITRWSVNDRGDIAFMGRFDDGLDRLVVGRRQIAEQVGDFNNDNTFDLADIRLLSEEIRSDDASEAFDLDQDGLVDRMDMAYWIADIKRTFIGDSDLDGQFDSSDLVDALARGEYEDSIVGNSSWLDGDWNGDGEFDSFDLVFALQDGGYEKSDARVAAVPEPLGTSLLLWAVGLLILRMRSGIEIVRLGGPLI